MLESDLYNSRKSVDTSFHKHYILFAFLRLYIFVIPPILREVLSFGTSNITGYLRQEDGTIKASQGTCSSLLIFLEEDLTLLLHAQKETIRGVSNFIL